MNTPSPASAASSTADANNVALFGTLAAEWWDPEGSSKLLHRINPARLAYIRSAIVGHFGVDERARHALSDLTALDVGCGGGLVAEPLARMGASVAGIDAGADVIEVARAHADAQGLAIDYRVGDVIDLAAENPERFDVITCLEVVEHVEDLPGFLRAVRTALKPGGLLIFSTPNRTALSYAVLIVGAEKLTRLIPDGGHDWKKFLIPAELSAVMANAGLDVKQLNGLGWSPFKGFHISDDVGVTYIGTATRS